jgi:hypothetical protein
MKKTRLLVLGLAVVYAFFSSTAQAQLLDKKVMITINQPMEIPGSHAIVLPPGTYVLKMLNSPGAREVVQFLNADETKLYSTVIGIPDYRLRVAEEPQITFYEPEPGRALPIRGLFYSGDNRGVEFSYSRERKREVAQAARAHLISPTDAGIGH